MQKLKHHCIQKLVEFLTHRIKLLRELYTLEYLARENSLPAKQLFFEYNAPTQLKN